MCGVFRADINTGTRQALFVLPEKTLVEVSARNNFKGIDVLLALSLLEDNIDIVELLRFLILKSLEHYNDFESYIEDINKYASEKEDTDSQESSYSSPSSFIDSHIFSKMPNKKYMRMIAEGVKAKSNDMFDGLLDESILSMLSSTLKVVTEEEEINKSYSTEKIDENEVTAPSEKFLDGMSLVSLLLTGVTASGKEHQIELASIKKGDAMENFESIFSLIPEEIKVSKDSLDRIVISLDEKNENNIIDSIEVSFGKSPAK